jgi:hypothetical protein
MLQKNLVTNEQSNWWFNCIKNIESKTEKSTNSKIIQQLNNGLEIIRLKKDKSKQLNFQICIKLAIYLQNRLNYENNDVAENNLLYSKPDTNELLPVHEKIKYLNLYASKYWCFIANYLKITFDFGDDNDISLNESFKTLNLDTSKKRAVIFFDIFDNFTDLFHNEQFNNNIYQLALLYLANKKFQDDEYFNVYDLIKDLKFDKQNFNDKIEYKVAKVFLFCLKNFLIIRLFFFF